MMNNFGSLLSNIGLFLCVGAIILAVIAVFAIRALTSARKTGQGNGNATIWNQPGNEQPQYNDPNINTSGGFGGVPTTGPTNNEPTNRPFGSSGGTGSDNNPNPNAGFGNLGGQQQQRPQQRPKQDDNDINSGGGFGGK